MQINTGDGKKKGKLQQVRNSRWLETRIGLPIDPNSKEGQDAKAQQEGKLDVEMKDDN